jgi:hypothetical protein
MKFNKNDKVKLTKNAKNYYLKHNMKEHVAEFGNCIGIVIGPTFKNGEGNEIDVKWQPSNLRYAYLPHELEKVVK